MTYTNGHKNGNGYYAKPHTEQPPNNLEAEEATLGSILIDYGYLSALDFLKPEDFYLERHGWIYRAMVDLFTKGQPVDLVLLSDLLKERGQLEESGGESYLTSLLNRTPTAIHAEHYARLIERDSLRRRLLQAAGKIAKIACANDADPDNLLAEAESLLLEISNNRAGKPATCFMGDLANLVYDHIERVRQVGNGLTGIPTGLTGLDRLLGGLQRSDMVVMAGRPGMGKTSLAMQIAKTAAKKQGKRTLFFSLEMGKEQLGQRVIASETGIDVPRIRAGNIRDEEWPVFFEAQKTLSAWPIAVDDAAVLTPTSLRSKAIRHQAEHGLDLIIIDYLQLMRGDGRYNGNRVQEVSDISRACKMVARELNVPLLALSSLSRACESRSDKRPMLSDLRESGSIEADSDVVIFLYRDDVYNPETEKPNVAEVIVSKHRSGPTGILEAYFKKHLTEFVDLEVRVVDFNQVD